MGSPTKAELAAQVAALRKALAREKAKRGRLEGLQAEAQERQAATSEILQVIARSPSDAQPVFEAIVASAARLCDAEFSAVARIEDGLLHLVAMSNMSPAETAAYRSLFPRPPARDFVIGRAFIDGAPVHVEDVRADPDYDPRTLAVLQQAAPYRSYLGIPILRDGVPIGAIGCGRRRVKPFTRAQIELVQTFADQAVIAIENVRLFSELRARNRDLTDALDQQTATAEVLKVISQAQADVQPVLEALAESATRLFGAEGGRLARIRRASVPVSCGTVGPVPSCSELLAQNVSRRRRRLDDRTVLRRAPDIHIVDVLDRSPSHRVPRRPSGGGLRSVLGVPDAAGQDDVGRRDRMYRTEAGGFTAHRDRADRDLRRPGRDRHRERAPAQRAAGQERRPHRGPRAADSDQRDPARDLAVPRPNVQPVFDTIAQSAVRFCDGIRRRACSGSTASCFTWWPTHNFTPEARGALRAYLSAALDRARACRCRAVLDRASVHVPDRRAGPRVSPSSRQPAA